MVGIPRCTPDNIDLEDWEVWKDIREDTTGIFQWESSFSSQVISQLFSDETIEKIRKILPDVPYLKLFSFGNALIRPCGASVREKACLGEVNVTGIKELDNLLAPELGCCIVQETIMSFVMKFCGFSLNEADKLRKCVSKDSLILMEDGSKEYVCDVKVGDYVQSFDFNGHLEPKKVIGVYDNGEKYVYSVRTKNGFVIKTTNDHKFLTQRGWVELSDIDIVKDCIVSATPINNNFIVEYTQIESIESMKLSRVFDLEVEDNHNFVANGIVVHNCIAKKKFDMLQEMLPQVKQGFINNMQDKYNLTNEQCDAIIDPIIKCFYDASRYSFSWNHSDAYSFIGHACGWLRHYYPLEFCATALNVLSKSSKPEKEEKMKKLSEYLKKKQYSVLPPKFRYSKSEYYIDQATNSIYKGILSIKFMNNSIAEELYALRDNEYKYFMDLLYDISKKTGVNSKQLDILIKLDFFREFGNVRLLSGLVDIFEKFKKGEAKQISISKITDPIMTDIIKRHCRATEKTYLQLETMDILHEIEEYTKTLDIQDISIKLKVQNQLDYMGYVDFRSGKEGDRCRLLILDIKPLNKKSDGATWAYAVQTLSLGSGKTSEILIYDKIFKENKFQKFDVIVANPKTLVKKVWNDRTSWYLNSYKIEV